MLFRRVCIAVAIFVAALFLTSYRPESLAPYPASNTTALNALPYGAYARGTVNRKFLRPANPRPSIRVVFSMPRKLLRDHVLSPSTASSSYSHRSAHGRFWSHLRAKQQHEELAHQLKASWTDVATRPRMFGGDPLLHGNVIYGTPRPPTPVTPYFEKRRGNFEGHALQLILLSVTLCMVVITSTTVLVMYPIRFNPFTVARLFVPILGE